MQESRIENTVITTRCGLCQQDIVFHELCEHVRRHVADGEDMDDWDDGLDD